jgi:hypothetical protein
MRRREFITLVGGAAAMWPLRAIAQQSARSRRIGVLYDYAKDDAAGRVQIDAFRDELAKLGWIEGQKSSLICRQVTLRPTFCVPMPEN